MINIIAKIIFNIIFTFFLTFGIVVGLYIFSLSSLILYVVISSEIQSSACIVSSILFIILTGVLYILLLFFGIS
ncbi:hypothetical protein AMV202 [Betaentomopoxvirus amoorei]|uniref:AMV202 n=1 Tax=Amsacta moorei entomopoxvirus TaxID=28321 RepID=Q9EMK4_AMEPV|nr:hypothetical protein AMV202 [Amsacta moorei entomopoxvirus]AAG02908.1 AMV202 [Amsacta moorei entomopoxvirus]